MRNLALDQGDLVQAFPINKKTLIGTFTNQNVGEFVLIHADENCTCAIGFISGEIINFNLIQGDDIGIGEDAVVFTSSGVCKIS